MTFFEYMKGKRPYDIQVKAGLSLPTIYRAMAGVPLSYPSAVKLSKATKGKVSVTELCDGVRAGGSRR